MTEEPKETSHGVKRKEAPELGEDLPVSPVKKIKEVHDSDQTPHHIEIKLESEYTPIIIEPPPLLEPNATSASPIPLDSVLPNPTIITPPANDEPKSIPQPAHMPLVEIPSHRLLTNDEEKELLDQLQNQEKINPVLARFRRKLAIRQAKRKQGLEEKILDLDQFITTLMNTSEKKERRLVQFYPKKQIYNYLKSIPSPKKLKSSSNGPMPSSISSSSFLNNNNIIAIKKEGDPNANKKPIPPLNSTSAIKPILPTPGSSTGISVTVKPSTNTNTMARPAGTAAMPISVKVAPGTNAISINQAYLSGAAKTPILIPGLKTGTGVLTGNMVTAGMLAGGLVKGPGNMPIAVRVQPGQTHMQAVRVPTTGMPKGNISVVPVSVPKTGVKSLPAGTAKVGNPGIAVPAQMLVSAPKGATSMQLKAITPVTLSAANTKMAMAGVVKSPNAVAIPKTGNIVSVAGYPNLTAGNGKGPHSHGQVINVGGRTAVVVPVSTAKLGQAMPNVSKPGTTTANVLSPTSRGSAIAISPSTASAIAAVTGVAPPALVKGQPLPASIKSMPLIQALAKTAVQSAVPVPTAAAKQIAIQPKSAPVPLAPRPPPIAPNVKSPVTPLTAVVTPATVVSVANTNAIPSPNVHAPTASSHHTTAETKTDDSTANSNSNSTPKATNLPTNAVKPTATSNNSSDNRTSDSPDIEKKSTASAKKEGAKPASNKKGAKSEAPEKEDKEPERGKEETSAEGDDENNSRRRTTRSAAKTAPAAPKKGNSKAKKGKKF